MLRLETILICLCLWVLIMGLTLLGIKSCKSCSRKKQTQSILQVENVELNDFLIIDERLLLLESEKAQRGILECGKKLTGYVIDPVGFILTLVCVESDFGKNTDGGKGEIGIMQIHPFWVRHSGLSYEDLMDDYNNVCFAIRLLEEYFAKYSDIFMVLKAYNMGEKNIEKNLKKSYLNRFFECAKKVKWQNVKWQDVKW